MKVENTRVYGIDEHLVRAMRNPMDSWDRSDSCWEEVKHGPDSVVFTLGKADKRLFLNLCKAGSEHRKILRTIHVGVTLTLPIYLWSEFDTYKVGTTRNSCSTMHTLGKRSLFKKDFQYGRVLPETLKTLNGLARKYRETKDYDCVREMKCYLPSGFLQKADLDISYETLLNMFAQRRDHRLAEWKYTGQANTKSFCNWISTLPYMKEILSELKLIP